MTPSNPFAAISLNGDFTRRGVTLVVPKDRVRALLPAGLELGEQTLTQIAGTHPVMLFFNDIFRLRVSIPTLIPNMTYHELHIGVPYTYLSNGPVKPGSPGPYYFMQRLYLDNLLAIFGGIIGWGFPKEMAKALVTANSYTVTSPTGQSVASLTWTTPVSAYGRIQDYAYFAPIQQILSQTLISMVPASVGPFFVLSDFDLAWDAAGIRPLLLSNLEMAWEAGQASLEGNRESVPRYTPEWSPQGIDTTSLGSWELRVPWRLSLPYPPPHSFRR